jgi:hypothetical protein
MEEAEILKKYGRNGRLTQMPTKHEPRMAVLAWLATRFQMDVDYREREVNDLLSGQDVDYATLRRLLVDYRFLTRADGIYRRTTLGTENPASDTNNKTGA